VAAAVSAAMDKRKIEVWEVLSPCRGASMPARIRCPSKGAVAMLHARIASTWSIENGSVDRNGLDWWNAR
jgi:hypothetical protein